MSGTGVLRPDRTYWGLTGNQTDTQEEKRMQKWARYQFLPGTPLGKDGRRVTASEEHIALSCKAAQEGMVLLKNENSVLPLKRGQRVALFGKGTFDYVKGGGGSGDVTVSYNRNLYEGFKELGDRVAVFENLADYYRTYVEHAYEEGSQPGMLAEPEVPADLLSEAKAYTDTAIISISRYSGEGWDRKSSFDGDKLQKEDGDLTGVAAKIFKKGDFYLTDEEQKMVDAVTESFGCVIVVLNVGGIVDTGWFRDYDRIQGVLLAFQGGMEGGLAAATLLCGLNTPSGKLSDTYAARLEDYPSTKTFHASNDHVDYFEDIYVGYRYFETIPGMAEKVVYPFGFGLSYTTFEIRDVAITQNGDDFRVLAEVLNTGDFSGKEVVQVYCEKPQGKLGKPARELVAFAKTKALAPGESQRLCMSFDAYGLASYDDLGKIEKSAYVLEAGDYFFHVGTSVRDTVKNAFVFRVDSDRVVEKLSEKMAPAELEKRMLADGSFETLPMGTPNDKNENALTPLSEAEYEGFTPDVDFKAGQHMWGPGIENVKTLSDVAAGKVTLDDFLSQLSDRMLAELLGGQPNTGLADTFGFGNLPLYGIPNVMTEDGPAGLRIRPDRGVCTTAWPCATLLASSWDPCIIEEVGYHAGLEVKENNIGFWLTPAINIHRSPLCGRNFEYYSEDPYLTGKLASAMVRGIQSNRIGASVKHFALNNKETNRKQCDSRASERAIREIYLKAFEIIVKEADPWTIMSSYNVINGHRASEYKDMLEGILRDEWDFKGFVTTDWWTAGEHYKELLAGNDIKMGRGYPDRLMEALEKGVITRENMLVSVKRMLNVLMRLE